MTQNVEVRIRDTLHLDYSVLVGAYEDAREQGFTEIGRAPAREKFEQIRADVDELLQDRNPFHWPLEFPEVFAGHEVGFAAMMGNPPFQGGSKITGALGTDYRDYLVEHLAMVSEE